MKKRYFFGLSVVLLFLLSCASSNKSQQINTNILSSQVQQHQNITTPIYWTGDGGKGKSRYISISTRPYQLLGSRVTSTGFWYEYNGTSPGRIDFENYRLTGYTGTETDIIIPSSINGIRVVSIHRRFFTEQRNTTSITIPPSITSIERFTFSDFFNLVNITIGSDVTLGEYPLANILDVNRQYYDSFPREFDAFYNANGRHGGTYIYNNSTRQWTLPGGITEPQNRRSTRR